MVDDFDTTAIIPPTPASHDKRGGGGSSWPRRPPSAKPAEWNVVDQSTVLGAPEGTLPPSVEQKIQALVAEVERLRHEAELSRHYEAFLGEEADRHPVLPVLNRRALLRALGQMLAASERMGGTGAFLYLHVGGIERLRVSRGLAAADAVLTQVAEALRAELRATDLIGYLDGGDFGIALALAEADGAAEKARELAARLSEQSFVLSEREQSFALNDRDVHFVIRYGLVCFQGGQTAEQVLDEADRLRRHANGAAHPDDEWRQTPSPGERDPPA